MNKILEVLSVNISEKKGTIKKPVNQIMVTENGIQGDAHAGFWNRQVSLLGMESFDKFMMNNSKHLTYGDFAENITTKGMLLYQARPLDRFISEDLILEITQIGKKCHGGSCTILQETGNCIMPTEGIFCRVVHPGSLKPGNRIHYIPRIYTVKVLTISDRSSAGIYSDRSGPVIKELVEQYFHSMDLKVDISDSIIPDQPDIIENEIKAAVSQKKDMIITTGGTGLGPKDFTPDVVKKITDKEIPGLMEYIRLKYGAENPNALISRSIAAIKDQTLIYAIPGNPKAAKEYISEISKTILHSLYMIHGLDTH